MKKDNTTLLVIGFLSATLLLFRKRSASGVGRLFGGNSGYSGYSMSMRAVQARNEGRYPKTDFKRVYGLTESVLQTLLSMGWIDNSEWHHTSKFGNKTVFYGWEDDIYKEVYQQHKQEFDKLVRKKNDNIADIFREYAEPYFEEKRRKEELQREQREREVEEEKKLNKWKARYNHFLKKAIETILADREEVRESILQNPFDGKTYYNGYWINLPDVHIQIDYVGNILNYAYYVDKSHKAEARKKAKQYVSDLLAEADQMAREQMEDV